MKTVLGLGLIGVGRDERPPGPSGRSTGVAAPRGLERSHLLSAIAAVRTFDDWRRRAAGRRSYSQPARGARGDAAPPRRDAGRRPRWRTRRMAAAPCRSRPRTSSRSRCPSTCARSATSRRSSTVDSPRAGHRPADRASNSPKARTSTQGQLLFTIDPRPFEVARASRPKPRSRRTRRRRRTREAQRARYDDLLKRGLVAQADFDTSRRTADALQRDDRRRQGRDREREAAAAVHEDSSRRSSGRTGALLVHQGALVRTNDTTPLVVINQIAPVYVTLRRARRSTCRRFAPSRRAAPLVRSTAACAGRHDAPSTGTVTFIDNAVDPTTDTIRLKATFPNARSPAVAGRSSSTSRCSCRVDPHAIVVPTARRADRPAGPVRLRRQGRTRRSRCGR